MRSQRLDICDGDTDELQFNVYFQVYASISSMRRGIRRLLAPPSVKPVPGNAGWDTAIAYTTSFNPDTKKFPKDIVVFLSKTCIGPDVVAHELTHVLTAIQRDTMQVLGTCSRWGKKKAEASEDLAETMQMLTREFWKWWETPEKEQN